MQRMLLGLSLLSLTILSYLYTYEKTNGKFNPINLDQWLNIFENILMHPSKLIEIKVIIFISACVFMIPGTIFGIIMLISGVKKIINERKNKTIIHKKGENKKPSKEKIKTTDTKSNKKDTEKKTIERKAHIKVPLLKSEKIKKIKEFKPVKIWDKVEIPSISIKEIIKKLNIIKKPIKKEVLEKKDNKRVSLSIKKLVQKIFNYISIFIYALTRGEVEESQTEKKERDSAKSTKLHLGPDPKAFEDINDAMSDIDMLIEWNIIYKAQGSSNSEEFKLKGKNLFEKLSFKEQNKFKNLNSIHFESLSKKLELIEKKEEVEDYKDNEFTTEGSIENDGTDIKIDKEQVCSKNDNEENSELLMDYNNDDKEEIISDLNGEKENYHNKENTELLKIEDDSILEDKEIDESLLPIKSTNDQGKVSDIKKNTIEDLIEENINAKYIYSLLEELLRSESEYILKDPINDEFIEKWPTFEHREACLLKTILYISEEKNHLPENFNDLVLKGNNGKNLHRMLTRTIDDIYEKLTENKTHYDLVKIKNGEVLNSENLSSFMLNIKNQDDDIKSGEEIREITEENNQLDQIIENHEIDITIEKEKEQKSIENQNEENYELSTYDNINDQEDTLEMRSEIDIEKDDPINSKNEEEGREGKKDPIYEEIEVPSNKTWIRFEKIREKYIEVGKNITQMTYQGIQVKCEIDEDQTLYEYADSIIGSVKENEGSVLICTKYQLIPKGDWEIIIESNISQNPGFDTVYLKGLNAREGQILSIGDRNLRVISRWANNKNKKLFGIIHLDLEEEVVINGLKKIDEITKELEKSFLSNSGWSVRNDIPSNNAMLSYMQDDSQLPLI